MRSTPFIVCACLIALGGSHAHAERLVVADVRSAPELTDESNAVILLARTALADVVVDGDTTNLTVATAQAAIGTLKLDHAVVLELVRSGTDLQVTSTIVDKTGATQVAVVAAGDGDLVTLAKGVVDQVVLATKSVAKPVPEIGLGQLRPYADAMRLAHDDPAGAIAALEDADPAIAAKVTAIPRALAGLTAAASTPAGKLIVARALGTPDANDLRTTLSRALAVTPADDRHLNQLIVDALGTDQRRTALAFAAMVDYARLTAETHGKLLELAARSAAAGTASTAITSRIGLGAALAGVDVANALALVEPRELDKSQLEALDRVLAKNAAIPKAIATRVRAELAMRRKDGTEAAAIGAYALAAPADPRARLYKLWVASQPAQAAARPKPATERREPVLVVIGALLGMGAVLVVLLLLLSFRRRPAKVVIPAPVVRESGMVSVRIVIAAEDRQGIAIWTTDRRTCAYTDASGEANLELPPGDHLLNFESNGDVVTLSVGIGVESNQRLELELLRSKQSGQQPPLYQPEPMPMIANGKHAPRPMTEPPIALAPTILPENSNGFEDTAHAAPSMMEALARGATDAAGDEPPKKAATHMVTPFPTMSGYAPPPAATMPERPTPMPPPKLQPPEPMPMMIAPPKPAPIAPPKPAPIAPPKPAPIAAPKPAPIAPPKPASEEIEVSAPTMVAPIPVSPTVIAPMPLVPAPAMPKPAVPARLPAVPQRAGIVPSRVIERVAPILGGSASNAPAKLALLPIPGAAAAAEPAPAPAMDLELGAAGSTAPKEPVRPLPASFVLEHTNEAQRVLGGPAEVTNDGARALDNLDTKVRKVSDEPVEVSAITATTLTAVPTTLRTDATVPPDEVKDKEANEVAKDEAHKDDEAKEGDVEERAEATTVTPMDIPGEPTLVSTDEKKTDTADKVEVTIVGPPVAPLVTKPRPPIYQRRAPESTPTAGPLQLASRYQVEEEARTAGMMRGFDDRLKRQVGVELYPVLDPIATAKHVNTIAKLEHANLVRVYELIVEAGKAYLIGEYLAGKTLDQHIVERGIYPWIEAVTVIDSVCAGLEYAHSRSIIHRAIRPSVIVMQVTTAKLGGFALAPDLTAAGYVAPEILAGGAPDRRSDIYSIGATLWQALAGTPPPAERQPLPEIPKKLQMLVDAMLAKSPADRPATVESLRAGFKSLSDF